MCASKLDAVYRSFLITKFFTKGWGKPENLRRLFEFKKVVSNRDECFKLIDRDYPITITKEETTADCKIIEGHFLSPLERFLPGIMPEIVQKAHFQALLPLHWPEPGCKPMCLHLAGTGDHYFWRRRNLMVKPLLKDAGIGGIILENPFYGLRKPLDQVRSSLHNVSDIFVMGGCLILESLVLFQWCERNGLGPLGVTGLSMGGHMASLAATNWPKPLVLVPCLSWSTASAVFLQGVMAHSINWDLLEDQYLSDGVYREKLHKMVTVVDEAFLAGKKFAQKFSKSMDQSTNKIVEPKNNLDNKQTNKVLDDAQKINADVLKAQNNSSDKEIENVDSVNIDSGNTFTLKTLKYDELNDSNVKSSNTANVKSCSGDRTANVATKKFSQNIEIESAFKTKLRKVKMRLEETLEDELERFQEDMKRLLDEEKLSESLYMKLISNDRFELDSNDVEELNKLNKEKILLRVSAKYQKGLLAVNSKAFCTNSQPYIVSVQQEIPKMAIDAAKQKTNEKKGEKKSRNIAEITSDILTSLPFIKGKSSGKKIDISKIHWRDREALQFMRGIMDECTHLSNFSMPFDTSLIIAVCAKNDAYVPREDVGSLEDIWPGTEVRYVDAGHVSAYLLHQSLFRSCIAEAFERSKQKWKDGEHIM